MYTELNARKLCNTLGCETKYIEGPGVEEAKLVSAAMGFKQAGKEEAGSRIKVRTGLREQTCLFIMIGKYKRGMLC